MKYRVCVLFAGLALAVPGLACADDGWSGNAAVTSSYVSRGFDQSWHDPALQGGIDYNRNGWFASTWASTVSNYFIEDATVEWDTSAGYAGEHAGLRYRAGLYYYMYPGAKMSATGTRYNYGEVIVGAGMGPVDISWAATYTPDYFGDNSTTLGIGHDRNSRGSGYLSVDGNFPLGKQFTLGLHYGHQSVRHFSTYNWTDAKVSLGTSLHGFDFTLAWTRGWNAHGVYAGYTTGVPDGSGRVHVSDPIASRVALTVAHSF
jgi:uncharacterized protein (TIGR02001 family)